MIKKYLATFLICLIFNFPAFSAGNSDTSSKTSNLKKATKMIVKAKKYELKGKTKKANQRYSKALKYLFLANDENPLDPDTLNYLGFTSRKLGKFEDAEIYYLLGLEVNPKHFGINEYLGELYVNTGRIDKAKERLQVLKDCNCEEFQKLKSTIKSGNSKY